MNRITAVSTACFVLSLRCAGASPADNFNLTHWKLQLPLPGNGREAVQEVNGDELQKGFTSEFFYSGPGGTMVFWAPVTGSRTPNTKYPRTELREMVPADWPLTAHRAMSATCRVLQVPGTGKVVIGQIHGSDRGGEVCKLLWSRGRIEYHYKDDTGHELTAPLGKAALGERFSYQIRCADDVITVTVGDQSASHSYVAKKWQSDRYYFKAGDYCQDNAGAATDGARVEFSSLQTNP
ncbi:MAG TPA: polysaccharide lyase family 7 protein [Tepidisphaeraceae bacterium]|nr:polysaccharide lyase family 7 protein [Tepidisphaeraceae bacterium]